MNGVDDMERKPLTDEQIELARDAATRSYMRHMGGVGGQMITPADSFEYHFARAIEHAHGIKWDVSCDTLES